LEDTDAGPVDEAGFDNDDQADRAAAD